jgi:hypothetical protein
MGLASFRGTRDDVLQINRIAVVIVFAVVCCRLVLAGRVMVAFALVVSADARQMDVRLADVMFVARIVCVRNCGQLPGEVSKCGQQ